MPPLIPSPPSNTEDVANCYLAAPGGRGECHSAGNGLASLLQGLNLRSGKGQEWQLQDGMLPASIPGLLIFCL